MDRDFHNELNRLLARGLTQEQELIARRYYSDKERESMDESDFCGPHRSYPVKSQEDVTNAAGLAGHAENPSAVRACIKAKAKAHGWKLPDSWQEEDRSAMATPDPQPPQDNSSSHEVMTGNHSHVHTHMDGYSHEHEHEHSHDAGHDHAHMHAHRSDMPTHAFLYAPIVRIDKEKREVEGVATSEAVDSFKTVFSYEASKRAFQKWIERTANVREMHDKKAVAKGIGVYFDDAAKQVVVRSRVSRGAEDTWIKIQEGILNGYSVGAINPVWDKVERDGKTYPYLTSYDLTELSLVDNASNPDAQGLALCRADGLTELVDTTEEETPAPVTAVSTPEVDRAGARLSADSRSALHDMRDKAMALCGCDECQGMQSGGDGDNDADDRAITATLERLFSETLERLLSPVYARQQSFLARLTGSQQDYSTLQENYSTLERTYTSMQNEISTLRTEMTAAIERAANASSQPEVRAELSAVREVVERIAAQPIPGGPVLNGGGYPVDKRLANQPAAYGQTGNDPATVQAVLQRLQASGALNTPEAQTAAAALLVQPVRGRMG